MPNTGRRSLGCKPCRRMKVKCDEIHPTCTRCAKAQRECSWPEEPSIFHSMNVVSEERALRPPPPRKPSGVRKTSSGKRGSSKSRSNSPQKERSSSVSTATSDRRGSSISHLAISPELLQRELSAFSSLPSSARPFSPPPQQPLSTDWPGLALAYYISEFTIARDSQTGTEGHMEYLPDLLAEAPEGGFLREAARAVALVALGNRGSLTKLTVEASKSFGRSIPGLRESLEHPEPGDDLLGGTLLLAQYQLISADESGSSLSHSHAAVQPTLIRARGQSLFDTPRGCSLYRDIFFSLQLMNIARGKGPSLNAAVAPTGVWASYRGQSYADLSTTIVEVIHRTYQYMEESSNTTSALNPTMRYEGKPMEWWLGIRTTAEEAWAILAKAEQNEIEAPEKTKYQEAQGYEELDPSVSNDTPQSPRQARSNSPELPKKVFMFSSLPDAALWASIWVSLAKLIEALLSLHAALDSPASPFHSPTPRTPYQTADPASQLSSNASPQAYLNSVMRAIADKLLASFPYLLGEVDVDGRLVPGGHGKSIGAYFALWPLHVLAGVSVLTQREHDWVLDRLDAVGKVWGIKQAEVLVRWRKNQAQLIGRD